jgi:hypothetical protein
MRRLHAWRLSKMRRRPPLLWSRAIHLRYCRHRHLTLLLLHLSPWSSPPSHPLRHRRLHHRGRPLTSPSPTPGPGPTYPPCTSPRPRTDSPSRRPAHRRPWSMTRLPAPPPRLPTPVSRESGFKAGFHPRLRLRPSLKPPPTPLLGYPRVRSPRPSGGRLTPTSASTQLHRPRARASVDASAPAKYQLLAASRPPVRSPAAARVTGTGISLRGGISTAIETVVEPIPPLPRPRAVVT